MAAPTLRDILPPSPEQLQQQIIGDNQLYRGFVSGVKGITSGSIANDALNAESAGAAEANALRERALASQQAAGAYAPRVQSLRNVNGVGDAFDFAAGAIGQGVASMAPTLGAALALRAPGLGALGTRALPYAGAVGAGYLQEKGEAALGQYSDPVLAAAPVAQRQAAATTKGLVNAALEGIVPAGLTSLAGKNSLWRILAKDAVTEGATEGVQQYVGHLANKSLDPNRELDPWDIADAVAAGALTGGTVGAAHGAAHTPKDFVARTAQSIQDAATTAPSPKDFLDKVFAPTPTEENDPVAAGDMHSDMIDAVSAAGDKAAEVLDSMTAKRDELAKKYAEEILNDPNTPAAVRSQVEAMGGDYTSPQNQATLGAQYVGRRAGEAASTAAEFVKAFTDRVTKKNLQTPVTPDEEFSLHKDIIDNLTPAAKRRTDIIRDIPQIASGVSGIINKMSQVGAAPTEKNIAELQQLYSAATTLFADPAKTLKQLSDKLEMKRADGKKITPFMDLLAGVTTAQQDVAKNEGGSYLQARLVTPMGQEQVAQLAKFVDEFGMTDMKNSKQADKVLDGLAVAFGGKQEALQVLDYYGKANKLNAKQLLQYDENEVLDPESGMSAKELVPTKTYSFADPKTNRPFRTAERMAKHDAATMRQGTVASDSSKVGTIPYSQYADETGKDHKAEVVRLMNDVKARQEAAYMGYASELGLKGDKRGKLEMAKRFAAERRPSPDAKSTRLADIDRLQGELDMAREAYKQGGPKAALDLYEVNTAEQNEKGSLTATDEDLKAMATNKNDENMVSFTKTDGSKMVLSSQSMMKTQAAKEKGASAARGEPQNVREQRLLKEAIASVLAREDIKSMDEKSTPPSLVQRGRSDDTKAALAEQEDSVAQLKKRLDAAVQEYEDVNDEDARDKTRTGIERNIARLQSQYERYDGTHYTEPTNIKEAPTLIPKSAPQQAVIRQRQAVYKEALAAINDVDFQEKVDAEERGEETKKGARTFDETTGEQLGAYGDLKKDNTKRSTTPAAPDTPKTQAKNSFVGAKSNADSDFAAMLSADRALNDPKHVVDTFNRIVKATVGDIVKVITEDAGSSFSLAAEFDFDKAGKPFIRAIAGMFDSVLTPEVAAHHEAAHVVVQIVQQTEGKAAAKRMVDLANQDYIRKQVSEKMGITASYFLNSPEELFVQAYALWATGGLKLSSEPVLTKVFRAIKSFFAGMTQDEGLASAFHAIRNGEFANSGVELNHASLENRLHKSKHDFFSYGYGKPSRADVNKVLKELNLTSKDVDIQKIYDDKEAFAVLVALSAMVEADITNEEAAEIKGILTEYGIAPKSKGAGAISDKLIDAVYDVVHNENYSRLNTPEKALAFARAAKQVLEHLSAMSYADREAKYGEDRSDELVGLKNSLEEMFDQSGYMSFDWDMMWDGQDPTDAQRAELGRIIGGNSVEPKAILPQKSSYAAKDQAKWDKANKFIGRGSQYSSTNAYAKAIGPTRANTGNYEASDVVFVSAEGARPGRISPDFAEIKKATDAGATIIADNVYNRERSYNVGEREVAAFLARQGYQEKFGVWTKPNTAEAKQDARTDLGSNTDATQQEALDEIARIRGKDVAVAFARMAQIKGSGDFSMNKDKTDRLIRLAVDAANMKSVAWHESLHDFMAMLGGTREERTIKREMLEATQSPAVAARLRELLKDHPAALEQLTDPEERLAYTYQFWAEGVLQLTPKGVTLMGKVAKLFRDLLGIMSSDAKLEQYLIALHSGQLVDPSTVAQVIEKLDAKTLGNKLESIAGPLADGLSRVFTSATDRLRKHGIAELDELADLFHKDPGHEKGRAGMLQRRAQKEGQFSNAFEKLLEGTTARQRLDALENLQAMRAPSNDLEKGIASLLSNLHTYMLGAGVKTLDTKTGQWHDIRRVTNYFPRNWDADSIRKDEAGFKALLAKNGVPSDQVKAIYDTLAFNGGSTDLMENAKSLGFVPLAVHVNDRALTFINSTNAQYFAKYQNKDLTDIMTTYIRQAAHRAEYTRSFGNDGHVISDLLKRAQANGLTNAEEESLIPTIRGLEGTLGHDMNPTLKKAMAGVLTVENVLLMPMAIFSQMIDPVNIAMRTNQVKDAGAAYLRALKDLKKFVTRDKTVDYDRELTKMLGIISTDSMLETMGQTQGSMYMTKTMRDVNKQFFRYNGMEGWNNSMRIAATVAGEQYILANVGNSRAMEELNVDPKNVITLPQGTKFGEPGRMAVSLEQFESTGMSKADAMKAAAQIQEAMFRFVDGAVVRPNAAHRATWMSDPRFQLISHLKQFTYSFQSAVLARAKNEHLHGNSLPMMYLAASVPIMFASDMAKWVLTGTVPKNWTFFDYFTHAVARSGVLGKYEYSVKAAEDAARGNVPGISFAGPAVEHANILAQWIAGAPGSSTDKLIDRSIPLARYA